MSLSELLAARGIRSALIVDDVCDAVPRATDIGVGNPAWPTFNDDLTAEQRDRIIATYPLAGSSRFDDLIADDGYVATLWGLRDILAESVAPLFDGYIADHTADEKYVRLARTKLEALGLTCETAGRDFAAPARGVDLIVIDLFLGNAQDDVSLNVTKELLGKALEPRAADPPLVILMSRSSRIDEKRDEFRDDVGLIESAFRIIKKSDLEESDRLERQLERLAENVEDSRKLARFFHALEVGLTAATRRTLERLRKLKLSDIGQIQQLLLSVDGEPTGSYLVDVFDRVLQHEIEAEAGIIDAAKALNDFSSARHPPPYVAGSAELQDLVQRLLTQNERRLQLPGSLNAVVAFGDVLRMPTDSDAERLKRALLTGLTPDNVALVLTPACDLQRSAAPRILMLVGTLQPLQPKDWSYGNDARTPAIKIDGGLHWVKWNLKHIDTVSWAQLEKALTSDDIQIVARLRDAHALELQQKVLSGLGRVGLVSQLPATFPVEVEVYYANIEGRPARLDIAALNDGAVCFVGRDENGNQVIKLVMTEGSCDGIQEAISAVSEEDVAEGARKAFKHITSTADLRRMLEFGVNLKGAGAKDWTQIPSETGAPAGVAKMGLLAWNYTIPGEVIKGTHLNKAGIIILVRDAPRPDAPGLGDAIRSGLVEPIVAAPEDVPEEVTA
jgi:hypothetical protein